MLKIAKSFVDGLARGGREASFVRMIIELARTLGVTVIAEGIETQEQADALVDARVRPSARASTSAGPSRWAGAPAPLGRLTRCHGHPPGRISYIRPTLSGRAGSGR